MSYQLKLDEMLDALRASNHPRTEQFIQGVEHIAQAISNDLAAHLGIKNGIGTFEGTAFAGLCTAFFPAYKGQPLPEVFERFKFDNSEEWEL